MQQNRGETTKENLTSKRQATNEGVPRPRADLCGSNRPLLNYRAVISKAKYKSYIERRTLVKVKVIGAEAEDPSSNLKHRSESDRSINFDPSFLGQINKEVDNKDERISVGSYGSEQNIKFKVKQIKKAG